MSIIERAVPTGTEGVLRVPNLLGGVSTGMDRLGNDLYDLGELQPRTDDWYPKSSRVGNVSIEEAADREETMKEWFDDAFNAENRFHTDVPQRNGLPPCKAAGLKD